MHCVSGTTYLIFEDSSFGFSPAIDAETTRRKGRRKKLPEKSMHCLSFCWRFEESFDELFLCSAYRILAFFLSSLRLFSPADHYNFGCNNKPQNEFKCGWHLGHNCTFVHKCHRFGASESHIVGKAFNCQQFRSCLHKMNAGTWQPMMTCCRMRIHNHAICC